MNRTGRYPLWIAAALILCVGSMGGAFIGASIVQAGHAPEAVAAPTEVREAATMPTTFAPIVKAVLPAVVNISSTKVVRAAGRGDDPFGDLVPGFRGPDRPMRQQGEGSGVIVSPDGYIVTNDHVIDGATELKVSLADKREMKARLIGTDAKTDIALLKVEATNLPHVTLGSSAGVEVGDIALAIGNPFGLGQTVTMGIISATGRSGLGIEDYEDFLQTDASINPGNSGGALVNTKGELIGINTAILSGSGGNQGVGFAVPIDMARQIMNQLKDKGAVTRAWLGVRIGDLTPDAAADLSVKATRGAVIDEVVPNGPALKAGLKKDDVIVELNGKPVDAKSLRLSVGSTAPGTTVDLKVVRNGAERRLNVVLDTMPDDNPQVEQPQPAPRLRRR
ncbi:MAG TPA: Do family serine endopeptidase [Terriglobia bacterium]|nr:Do family serine endopeptidase [Terriglobia bacterium]